MNQINKQHNDKNSDKTAKYTIIAYSLGSIMSLDALLYAHADKNVFKSKNSEGNYNIPFLGYQENDDSLPDNSWIKNVDSFVTLGSPIDKFLIIFWLNYKYLNDPESWMDSELKGHRKEENDKISHYNYCDEQDPVGHDLDVVAFTTAIFSEGWCRLIISTIIFVGVCWLGRELINLSVLWRVVLRIKSRKLWEGHKASKKEGERDIYEIREAAAKKHTKSLNFRTRACFGLATI